MRVLLWPYGYYSIGDVQGVIVYLNVIFASRKMNIVYTLRRSHNNYTLLGPLFIYYKI
jgi:hypothetical protein